MELHQLQQVYTSEVSTPAKFLQAKLSCRIEQPESFEYYPRFSCRLIRDSVFVFCQIYFIFCDSLIPKDIVEERDLYRRTEAWYNAFLSSIRWIYDCIKFVTAKACSMFNINLYSDFTILLNLVQECYVEHLNLSFMQMQF